jgi:hypothetical protein
MHASKTLIQNSFRSAEALSLNGAAQRLFLFPLVYSPVLSLKQYASHFVNSVKSCDTWLKYGGRQNFLSHKRFPEMPELRDRGPNLHRAQTEKHHAA